MVGRLIADHGHALLFPDLKVDICHYPKGFLPYVRRWTGQTVGTIHDVIIGHYAEHYPASRSPLAFAYWTALLRRSIKQLDLIITVSETSRASIESFCHRERLACPPIVVTYEGARWENDFPAAAVKGEYLLHFGSAQPHKRTDTLLDFWEGLKNRKVDLPALQIVGSLSPAQRQRLDHTGGVSHVSWLDDSELMSTISSARAVIVSSEIEGFGLPALEAYYLGTPAVFVKGTAVEEVLGMGTPGGFTLESVESLGHALDEVLSMNAQMVRSCADNLRARYAWDQCARRTMNAYKMLA